MKNSVFFILVILIFVVKLETAFSQYQKYEFESGIVEYKMTGSQTGKRTVYFSDFGRREAIHFNGYSTLSGVKTALKEISIEDGLISYTLDLVTKRGYKFENPIYKELEKYKGHLWSYEEFKLSGGWKKVGSEYFLKKKCDIWELRYKDAHFVDWVWKGITLKSHLKMLGKKSVLIATKLNVPAIVEEKYLIPPTNIKIDSVDASKIYTY